MTPEQKAKDLLEKFAFAIRDGHDADGFTSNVIKARDCALIFVAELKEMTDGYNRRLAWNFWDRVEEEIVKETQHKLEFV